MTKIIGSIIAVSLAFAFWLWRRYFSKSAEIARLEKRIGLILEGQKDALENNDMVCFDYLDTERLQLCKKIRHLRR